jgi:hypothetical protein
MNKRFEDMTNEELADCLEAYGLLRAGLIADLTLAASKRITELDAKVKALFEDDRK